MSSSFRINMLDNNTITLLYNADDDFDNKIDMLQNLIFNYVVFNDSFYRKNEQLQHIDCDEQTKVEKKRILQQEYSYSNVYNYCLDHWLWFGKFDSYQWNYEDKVKSLLDRCGTFLLLGHFGHGGIITNYTNKKIINNEVPLSLTSSEVSDLFHSSANDREYTSQAKGQNIILTNEIITGNIDPDFKVKIHHKQRPKAMKRYKDSQYYKLKQLYKTDDIRIFKLHKLKNKDINYTYWKDSTEKFPEVIKPHNKKLLDKKTKESMCAKDYKKLANKPFRNLHGENLYEYRPHTIKGNKKGIIDRSKPYKWEWSYVWADNVFEFDGSKYRIDDSVEQYQGKLTKMNRKKVPDMEVRYEMDKILVFEQDGKRYYFDQKIDRIDNDLIHAI